MSEAIDCPLCEGRDHRHLWRVDGFDIVRCRCGLIYVSNPIAEAEELYGAGYLGDQIEVNYSAKAGLDDPFGWLYHLNRERMRAVGRIVKRGWLLDVGCGRGFFLLTAREFGWQVQGVDISPAAVEFARRRYRLDVRVGTLEAQHLPGESFDAVTLWHVLEHLPHPLTTIREIRRILRPGGRLFVEVPNVDGLLFRLRLSRWRGGNHPRYHRFLFSRETLIRLLESEGFERKTIERFSYGLSSPTPRGTARWLIKRGLSLIDRDSTIGVMARKS